MRRGGKDRLGPPIVDGGIGGGDFLLIVFIFGFILAASLRKTPAESTAKPAVETQRCAGGVK